MNQFKIWCAGCSSGIEPYSIAILLKELNLLDSCILYATDFNNNILSIAKNGLYGNHILNTANENYLLSGGISDFSSYITSNHTYFETKPEIRSHVHFFKHDLTTDTVFNQFDLILCRNVLIYFDDILKENVLSLLHKSTSDSGLLVSGMSEKLQFYTSSHKFDIYKPAFNVYKKT